MKKDFWVYQIYVKSFQDSNGDGIGDLRGIIQRLDYLQYLGVKYLWLTPIYPSPQKDNGYDVSHYCEINPTYGKMKDFEKLVEEAEKRNMFIMMDMVFNHTSTEHEWFQKALKGEEKYQNYYIFKESKNNKAPTNWLSKFGGSSWEYVPSLNQYYLHLFDKTQADLNWDNPEVREEIKKVVNFWCQKGVKGLRFDVINLISKPKEFKDDLEGDGRRFYTDGSHIHEYLKELHRDSFGKYKDIITVGEMSSTSLEACQKYTNPEEKELSMVFNFHHLKVDYPNNQKWVLGEIDFFALKKLFKKWQIGLEKTKGTMALFWSNHDQPRILSRFGNEEKINISGKMLANVMYLMDGVPYLYQGEEIGMLNAHFETLENYKDIESINLYREFKEKGVSEKEIFKILKERSRDNSRTPMQWTKKTLGEFTSQSPWIELSHKRSNQSVEESLNDQGSLLEHYRFLIQLKKEEDCLIEGKYEILEESHQEVYAYSREKEGKKFIIISNFFDKETDFPFREKFYQIISNNYESFSQEEGFVKLKPYQSLILKVTSIAS